MECFIYRRIYMLEMFLDFIRKTVAKCDSVSLKPRRIYLFVELLIKR